MFFKRTPPLCVLTATAVSGIRHRHCPSPPSPLQRIWKGLCWMLPRQGSILCLGRNILHSLPAKHQEVCDTNTNDAHQIHSEYEKHIENFVLLCRRFRRQDVRNGDPNTLCSGGIILKWLLCLGYWFEVPKTLDVTYSDSTHRGSPHVTSHCRCAKKILKRFHPSPLVTSGPRNYNEAFCHYLSFCHKTESDSFLKLKELQSNVITSCGMPEGLGKMKGHSNCF